MSWGIAKGLEGLYADTGKRESARQDLNTLAGLKQQIEYDKGQKKLAEKEYNDYRAKVSEYSKTLLEPDRKRLNEKAKYEAKKIAEQVRMYGGSVKSFFDGGGATSMQSYVDNITNSEEAARYDQNAKNMELIIEAQKTGQINRFDLANLDAYKNGRSLDVTYTGLLQDINVPYDEYADNEEIPVDRVIAENEIALRQNYQLDNPGKPEPTQDELRGYVQYLHPHLVGTSYQKRIAEERLKLDKYKAAQAEKEKETKRLNALNKLNSSKTGTSKTSKENTATEMSEKSYSDVARDVHNRVYTKNGGMTVKELKEMSINEDGTWNNNGVFGDDENLKNMNDVIHSKFKSVNFENVDYFPVNAQALSYTGSQLKDYGDAVGLPIDEKGRITQEDLKNVVVYSVDGQRIDMDNLPDGATATTVVDVLTAKSQNPETGVESEEILVQQFDSKFNPAGLNPFSDDEVIENVGAYDMDSFNKRYSGLDDAKVENKQMIAVRSGDDVYYIEPQQNVYSNIKAQSKLYNISDDKFTDLSENKRIKSEEKETRSKNERSKEHEYDDFVANASSYYDQDPKISNWIKVTSGNIANNDHIGGRTRFLKSWLMINSKSEENGEVKYNENTSFTQDELFKMNPVTAYKEEEDAMSSEDREKNMKKLNTYLNKKYSNGSNFNSVLELFSSKSLSDRELVDALIEYNKITGHNEEQTQPLVDAYHFLGRIQ